MPSLKSVTQRGKILGVWKHYFNHIDSSSDEEDTISKKETITRSGRKATSFRH